MIGRRLPGPKGRHPYQKPPKVSNREMRQLDRNSTEGETTLNTYKLGMMLVFIRHGKWCNSLRRGPMPIDFRTKSTRSDKGRA